VRSFGAEAIRARGRTLAFVLVREAEKEFEQIGKDDPTCAMAQWGLAMSQWHQLWNHPDAATTKKGRAEIKKARSLHAGTARERDYIDAMKAFYGGKGNHDRRATAYSHSMERVFQHNPDDHEAAAFYALSLLAAADDNDRISRLTRRPRRFWRNYLPPSRTIRE